MNIINISLYGHSQNVFCSILQYVQYLPIFVRLWAPGTEHYSTKYILTYILLSKMHHYILT